MRGLNVQCCSHDNRNNQSPLLHPLLSPLLSPLFHSLSSRLPTISQFLSRVISTCSSSYKTHETKTQVMSSLLASQHRPIRLTRAESKQPYLHYIVSYLERSLLLIGAVLSAETKGPYLRYNVSYFGPLSGLKWRVFIGCGARRMRQGAQERVMSPVPNYPMLQRA
jgi:hypothetical protein